MDQIIHVETRNDPDGEFILRMQTADERWLEFSFTHLGKVQAMHSILTGVSVIPVEALPVGKFYFYPVSRGTLKNPEIRFEIGGHSASAHVTDDELRRLFESIRDYLRPSS